MTLPDESSLSTSGSVTLLTSLIDVEMDVVNVTGEKIGVVWCTVIVSEYRIEILELHLIIFKETH